MKKIFSSLCGMAVVVLSGISFTLAYTQEQYDAYKWAYKYGITTQPNIKAANLDGKITRQALAKMIVNYLENVVGIENNYSKLCSFTDENNITSDLKPYTKKICAYQIMGSNGKNFNPKKSVDRAQLGTVFSRILRGDKYDASGKGYYFYHLNALKDAGIMNNISNSTGSYAKRGDVLIMLKRIYDKFGSNIYMNNSNKSSNNTIVRKTDANGFSYYDSYLDNPPLSNAMKELKLRSTSCPNIFCQQVGDDGTYSNQKHYYWNDKKGTMTLIPGVYYVSDCVYYDNIYGSSSSSSYVAEDDDEDYLSVVYDNSNVIYTSKDGTKYYYDDKFLNMLKNTAEKEGESNLADYLKIEAEYFKNGLDQLADLDEEDLLESMGIDVEDIDPDNMTKQEKQELIKKFKSGLDKLISENKTKNSNFLKDLGKVTKNIKNDKFGLKEKYDKTKTFMEANNEFLDLYSESMLSLIELALMDEGNENSEEGMAQAFGLIGIALAYQGTAQEYKTYVEEWAINTIKLIGLDLTNGENENKSTLPDIVGNLTVIDTSTKMPISEGFEPLTVILDASKTKVNVEGDEILYFTWDFGDGEIRRNQQNGVIAHTYNYNYEKENGFFEPKVTVTTLKGLEQTIIGPTITVKKSKTTNDSMNNNIKAFVEDMIANIPVKGNKNARFTIVEYTDLHCPYCQRHSSDETIDNVIKQFPDEVNSVSRHFIIYGDESLQLASAMECIAELKPGVYYEAFKKAFDAYPVDMDGLFSIAIELGVNKASLQNCIDQGKHTKSIEDTMNQASSLFGVTGAPGNVIIDRKTGNYKLVSGAYPVDEFVKVINELKNTKS